MSEAWARCEVGRLSGAWPAIRKSVEYAKFQGYNVTLFEGPGLLSRQFEVRGDPAGVRMVYAQWQEWAKQ